MMNIEPGELVKIVKQHVINKSENSNFPKF